MTKKEAIELARNKVLEYQKGRKPVRAGLKMFKPGIRKELERIFPPGFSVESDLDHPAASKKGGEWCVRFDFTLPKGICVLPSCLFVLVDDVTGDATIPQIP